MDLQFVLNAFACAHYVLSYINKSDRGMSKLMGDRLEQSRKGNLGIKVRLKKLGNSFINAKKKPYTRYLECPSLDVVETNFSSLFDFSKNRTRKIFVPAPENDDKVAEFLEIEEADCLPLLDESGLV
ncbi:hypothetical protein JTE90_024780 [Oedothorax gibbosus]|uniref:Uncharacterized protein n=1 Tax=Oedothorax gibbosus TaxID=931172 RepID=A0AAV6U9Z2_9ARAC|nr:hypothetical protein JTE90_024780 [Oedothorax gibbosus]